MRWGALRIAASIVAIVFGCWSAIAADEVVDWRVVPEPAEFNYQIMAGGEATRHSWSIYVGSTTAFVTDVRADGFKLRGGAGYGAYDYASPRWDGRKKIPVAFEGAQAYSDVLFGYQHTFGKWIVKGFAGITQDRHAITPYDIENPVQGTKYGFKGALETWLTIGEYAFVQSDANWSQVFQTYAARIRAGYRLHPAWSVGAELGATGNAVYDAGRLGGFLRLEWNFGEVSISAGGAGDRSGLTGPYGALAFMIRF